MKKSMLVFAMLGIMPAVCAYGYDDYRSASSQYTTTRPSGTYTKTSTVRRTGGYNNYKTGPNGYTTNEIESYSASRTIEVSSN